MSQEVNWHERFTEVTKEAVELQGRLTGMRNAASALLKVLGSGECRKLEVPLDVAFAICDLAEQVRRP